MQNFDVVISDLDDTLWPAQDPSVLFRADEQQRLLYRTDPAIVAPTIVLNPFVVDILRAAETAKKPVIILTNNYQEFDVLLSQVLARYGLSTDNVYFWGVGDSMEPQAKRTHGEQVLSPLIIDKAKVVSERLGSLTNLRLLFLDDRPENGRALEALGASYIQTFPDWYRR